MERAISPRKRTWSPSPCQRSRWTKNERQTRTTSNKLESTSWLVFSPLISLWRSRVDRMQNVFWPVNEHMKASIRSHDDDYLPWPGSVFVHLVLHGLRFTCMCGLFALLCLWLPDWDWSAEVGRRILFGSLLVVRMIEDFSELLSARFLPRRLSLLYSAMLHN